MSAPTERELAFLAMNGFLRVTTFGWKNDHFKLVKDDLEFKNGIIFVQRQVLPHLPAEYISFGITI